MENSEKKKVLQEPLTLLLFAGIAGIAIFLRVFKLLDKSLCIDEIARFFVAKKPISDIIHIDKTGSFSSPFYNIILHFWYYTGDSEFIVRLFPLIFGIISIFVFGFVIIKIYSKVFDYRTALRIALLAVFFLALSPMHIHYSQEAGGPYTLYFLLILVSTYLFLEIMDSYSQSQFRYFLYFVFLLAICFYLHYFTLNFILAYNIIFLFYYSFFVKHKSIKEWLAKSWKWFFSQIILLIVVVPIIPTILYQASRGQPGPEVSIEDLRQLFFTFAVSQWLWTARTTLGIIMTVVFLAGLLVIFRKNRNNVFKRDLLLLSLFVAVIGISFLVAVKTCAFRYRYLIPLLAIYIILLARGVSFIKPKFVRALIILFVVITSLLSLNQYYFKQPYWEKDPWRDAVAFVEDNSIADDLIIFPISNEQPAFDYYYRNCALQLERHGLIRDYDIMKGPVFSFDMPSKDIIAQFENIVQKSSRIWVVTARMTIGPKGTKGIGHIIVDYMNATEKYHYVLSKYIGGRLNVFLYEVQR